MFHIIFTEPGKVISEVPCTGITKMPLPSFHKRNLELRENELIVNLILTVVIHSQQISGDTRLFRQLLNLEGEVPERYRNRYSPGVGIAR